MKISFKTLIITTLMMVLFFNLSFSQEENEDLVQFSGVIMDGAGSQLEAIPFAHVIVKNKYRGTNSDYYGFFSIVVEKGDTITFSAIGYKNVDFVVPDSLLENRYSIVQLMTQDIINLPETIVFPWPDRDHFKLEFLAMNVDQELREIAQVNLAQRALEKMRYDVEVDANESADFYLRRQADNYYHFGQAPAMNIFNPLAWAKFIEAWKRGDYKKK